MKNSLVILGFSLILFSCNRTDFSNPEDVLKHYRELKDKNMDAKLYQDYLSSKSKEFVTKDEYIKSGQTTDSDINNMKNITQKIIQYPIDVNEPTYRRYKVEDTHLFKKDTIKQRFYYTLINENGNWKIIWTETLLSFAEQKGSDGNYSEARKTLEKVIEINPFDGEAYEMLGWYYYRDNSLLQDERENGIVKNVKYAISLETDNASHYNAIAQYYASIKNYDLAIQNYQRGLEYCLNEYNKATIYANISGGYTSLNKYDKAEEYIKKSIAIDSEDAFSWFKYGSLMMAQQKYDTAKVYFEKAIPLPKMDNYLQGILYSSYSLCCIVTKNCNKAQEYITKALDIDPSNKSYQNIYEMAKNCK